MKIVACYKYVPEEQDIAVKGDQTLDFSSAQWKVGQYDLNAVEASMKLGEVEGGEVLALTAGGENLGNAKLQKGILSRGPAQMFGVKDAALDGVDSYATASVLKAGIEKIGSVDLVLCGEGSGDSYSQQVGPVLGSLLGWPTVNAVSKITPNGGKLTVERSLENGIEILEVALPAVVCVTSDINLPRIPSMKEILAAGKKPVTIWNLSDISASAQGVTETASILAPEQANRSQIIIEGSGEAEIETLFNHIRKAI